MPRASFNISLPPEMAREVDEAMRREHRTRSELVREALRVYFAMTSAPAYSPTAQERRAIALGRAEITRGELVSLNELNASLDRRPRQKRRESRPLRPKKRKRTTARGAR